MHARRISREEFEGCTGATTPVAFMRRRQQYVVHVPGTLGGPEFDLLWRYEIDGERRSMKMSSDAQLYVGVRERILAKHKETLDAWAKRARAMEKDGRLNRRTFGE